MTIVTSKERFKTSFGDAFIIENPPKISVGDAILLDGVECVVKQIIFPTRPTAEEMITIVI